MICNCFKAEYVRKCAIVLKRNKDNFSMVTFLKAQTMYYDMQLF